MDYKKIYDALMDKATEEKYERLGKHYTGELLVERHHIQPRAHGGYDSEFNLVPLTPREHYMAHRLLQKIYPQCPAMAKAVFFMSHGKVSNSKGLRPVPSKTYSRSRSLAIASQIGYKNHQSKLARIRDARTGRFVASNVCITEWCRMNGMNNTGLRKNANGQQGPALGYTAEFIDA